MSLFTENASNGIGRALSAGPDRVPARRLISTSAEVPFVSTLECKIRHNPPARQKSKAHRGFFFVTTPEALSKVAISFDIVAGTSLE